MRRRVGGGGDEEEGEGEVGCGMREEFERWRGKKMEAWAGGSGP